MEHSHPQTSSELFNFKERSRNLKRFPKFAADSLPSFPPLSLPPSLYFSQWQTLNISSKLDAGDASILCICSETRIHWGAENCAVMVENAERLIRVHFAAIISLSLSSNKQKKKKKREALLLHRSTWDASVTLCWQFGVWVLFRQTHRISMGAITVYRLA